MTKPDDIMPPMCLPTKQQTQELSDPLSPSSVFSGHRHVGGLPGLPRRALRVSSLPLNAPQFRT